MRIPHAICRLPKGSDLLEALTALCRREDMTRGAIQVIGALERASLAFYRQAEQAYAPHELPEHLELLCGMGNVSLKEGEPFVHLHLTLSRENGECVGGHAMPGCIVFAAEAVLFRLEGDPLNRVFDPPTGLFLWSE